MWLLSHVQELEAGVIKAIPAARREVPEWARVMERRDAGGPDLSQWVSCKARRSSFSRVMRSSAKGNLGMRPLVELNFLPSMFHVPNWKVRCLSLGWGASVATPSGSRFLSLQRRFHLPPSSPKAKYAVPSRKDPKAFGQICFVPSRAEW